MTADATEGAKHPLRDEVVKLLPQLIVLTLGGAIVSAAFQYFGQIRDQRAQQTAFSDCL
jgi:hypothetical protein